MNEQDAMLADIHDYVLSERKRLGITTTDTRVKSEPSGELNNEFAILLDIQLVSTTNGYGGWSELDDNQTLRGVYEVVQRRRGEPDRAS